MPQYKLIYFDLYGRAETARFLFHLADVPYEDIRYNFVTDWPDKKAETRWGVLPELEVDGKKLAQSTAINQYLAKQFGYNGKDDWEAARIQELLSAGDDLGPKFYPVFMEKDEAKREELMKNLVSDGIKPYYTRLEKCLEENGTGFFVGKELTVADILHFVFLTGLEEGIIPGVLAEFPKLTAFVERIQGIPKIKEWIEKRPQAPFSIMSKKKE